MLDSISKYLIGNITQTKSEVSKNEKNITVNGILWNAYDTYNSVIFDKKLILNSKSKTSVNKDEIIKFLEKKGLDNKLFKIILFDLWFGAGAGLTIYNSENKIEYISAYDPKNYNCDQFEYTKSNRFEFINDKVYIKNGSYKNLINGSHFLVRKDYDNFHNFYSVMDKCYTQLLAFNKISAYILRKTGKNFEREMFYQISSDTLQKIVDSDSNTEIALKNERNTQVFANIKQRITEMFKSVSNAPRIIQSAITPVFVDTEVDLDKLVKLKEAIIKEIALCCNVPASSLGISNSANKAQSETDKDNLTNQATIYTNIFIDVANYWLNQFYPDFSSDLYFTWQENETDETLQIREQNQKVFEFYTANASILENLGVEVDTNKLVELANSVSIPDLFKISNKPVQNIESVNTVTEDETIQTRADNNINIDETKLSIKPVKIDNWESRKDVNDSKVSIEKDIKRYIQSQLAKKKRSKEDFEDIFPKNKFKKYLTDLSKSIIDLYNERNISKFTVFDNILEYVDEVTDITYNGKDDYLGIWSTIDQGIEKDWSLERVFNNTVANIKASLYVPLFNETVSRTAKKAGANFIATVAKDDRLVRPIHFKNQNIIWRLTDTQYWLEPNCRCDKVYGSVQELLDAGFTNRNNY